MSEKKTWFITGCSSGLGLALAQEALQQGHRVVATARRPDTLQPLAGLGECLALKLDVTQPGQVQAAVAAACERFGGVDVLVNNAGQGFITSVEDAPEAEMRAVFELNFFGLVAVTRAFLPRLRAQRSGHIINISSIAGLIGRVGSAYYAATKFAVEGFSEALAAEVRDFGLKVTIAELAGFRTGFSAAIVRGEVGSYQQTVGARLDAIGANIDKVPGDPARAARLLVSIAGAADAPLRLPLGQGAVETLERKIAMLQADLDKGRQAALDCDFPKA